VMVRGGERELDGPLRRVFSSAIKSSRALLNWL